MLEGKKCFSCTERHKADLRCNYMWNDELSLQKCEVSFSERPDFIWRQYWPLSTQNKIISVFSAPFHPFFCRVIADRTAHLQYVDLALSPSWPERFTKTRVGCRGKGKKTETETFLFSFIAYYFSSQFSFSQPRSLSLSLAFPSYWSATPAAKQRAENALWYFGRWEGGRKKERYRERGPKNRRQGGKWDGEKGGVVCLNFPLKESTAAAQENRDGWKDGERRRRWVNVSLDHTLTHTLYTHIHTIQNRWDFLELTV